MLTSLKKYFADNISVDKSATADDSARKLQIATCALLVEMANSDDQFSNEEKERIVGILKNRFGLDDNQVDELFEITRQEIKNSLDLYGFARMINKHYNEAQKIAVIEIIWEVIYADSQLSAYEDYLVHKYHKMLDLTHAQFIEAKTRVLERMNKDR
jgi:uncharacterized tellurite resistance protein B-like protein